MSDFHPAVMRQVRALEKLEPACGVAIDQFGAAWQYGGDRAPYWYRAYDSNKPLSTIELAQRMADR